MSVAETLLNATLVLIPLWLGLVRYLTSEVEFESETTANLVGLGIVLVLMGILYSMSIAIENLIRDSQELRNGLYALFITLTLTGIGGVFFIIREIPEVSSSIVVGLPLITLIGVAGFTLLASQIFANVAALSISNVTALIGTIAVIVQFIGISYRFKETLHER